MLRCSYSILEALQVISDGTLAGRMALVVGHRKVSSRKPVGHTNLGSWRLVLDVGFPLEELSRSSVL